MKKVFSNSSMLQCIFTDEGITFYGTQQNVFFPYGCIDTVSMSFMGILQATCHPRVCTFAVDRKDRAAVKDMLAFAKDAMANAPSAEPVVIDLTKKDESQRVSPDLPPEEQLKQYKALFVQGAISKAEYDIWKCQLK